jgi:hypothetical protein
MTRELQPKENLLNILTNSICDVGCWNWWTQALPDLFQIEFGGIQLYFPSDDILLPPSSSIAIQFKGPKSISFLTKKNDNKINNELWYNLLANDKIGPFTCSHDQFTFTSDILISEILNEAKSTETIHGYKPNHNQFINEKFKLAFWAGEYGLAISCDEIRLLSQKGIIELNMIQTLNTEWWNYWKRYWELRHTKDALPKDYACEATIPLQDSKQ